ncbi:hypothetical protein BGX24_003759, partial [Mortierella sp. AD032]
MTTRHATAIPAPAPQAPAQPAPAPAAPQQQPQQAPAAAAPAPPPPSPPSPPTAEKAPARPNDPPSPAAAAATPLPPSPVPSPAHSSSPSPPSTPHGPSPVIPVSPPVSPIATTPTSSTHSSSTRNHSSTRDHQPSGTPFDINSGNNNSYQGNEANNRIMLTVTLAVVFVILAGMGLVVYCLFRRRSAKRRMHVFGGISGNKNTIGSLDSSTAAAAGGSSGIGGGSGGRKSFAGGNRRSSVGGDPIVTALAKMKEQQRRISDVDVSRALQDMTEQHQNALMTRRSSTLSLGGLHNLNHYQHSQQQQQHPGGHVVSPTLGPLRPHSASGAAGYRGGNGVGGADRGGQLSRRQSMSGIVIGSGEYVAGPLESSPDFRTTAYDDLYYPSRQFLYPSSGSGSSGANSNEQLLPPHHNHYQSYSSGPPSSANMSRRSSLSPGAYPTHGQSEMSSNVHQNPIPIFRAKTISTSSGQSYQQQMQYPQHYPPSAGYRSAPVPPLHSSTPPLAPHPSQMHRRSAPAPATIASSSGGSSESISEYPTTTSTPGTSDSQKRLQGEVEGAGVGAVSGSSTGNVTDAPRSTSPMTDSSLEPSHPPSRTVLRQHSTSMLQQGSPSPYGHNNYGNHSGFLPNMGGGERARSPPSHLMSSSTSNLLDRQNRASYEQQHRASYDQHRASYDQHRVSSDGGASQFAIPPSITTRRRSMMPGSGGPSGPTSPTGYNPYQKQQMYGGQDYFGENPSSRQYPGGPPQSNSPYGYGNPYQDHHQSHQHQQQQHHQYNYQQLQHAAARRSATHL